MTLELRTLLRWWGVTCCAVHLVCFVNAAAAQTACTTKNLTEERFLAIKVGMSYAQVVALLQCAPSPGYHPEMKHTPQIDSFGNRSSEISWQNLGDNQAAGIRTIQVRFDRTGSTVTADRDGKFKEGSGF